MQDNGRALLLGHFMDDDLRWLRLGVLTDWRQTLARNGGGRWRTCHWLSAPSHMEDLHTVHPIGVARHWRLFTAYVRLKYIPAAPRCRGSDDDGLRYCVDSLFEFFRAPVLARVAEGKMVCGAVNQPCSQK